MSKLDEYKALLMNADSLDILYITAESAGMFFGAELVALTAVDTSGNIVLDLRFDVADNCYTGEEFHGIKEEDVAGLPRAVEVLDELRHFMTEKAYYCWSDWYCIFFSELIGEKTKLMSIEPYIVCNQHMRQIVSIKSDDKFLASFRKAAVKFNIENEDNLQGILAPERKAKIGFAIAKKVIAMSVIIDRIDELEQELKMAHRQLNDCFRHDKYRLSPAKGSDDDIPF